MFARNVPLLHLSGGGKGELICDEFRCSLQNLSNASDVNCGPLSDTNVRGKPSILNMRCSAFTVPRDVGLGISTTNGKLGSASVTINHVVP